MARKALIRPRLPPGGYAPAETRCSRRVRGLAKAIPWPRSLNLGKHARGGRGDRRLADGRRQVIQVPCHEVYANSVFTQYIFFEDLKITRYRRRERA
jgi:hypothetical protein